MSDDSQEALSAPQVVCGTFYNAEAFPKAKKELLWSLKQNREFWKSAVLYLDEESEQNLPSLGDSFREVIVDRNMPEHVLSAKKWCCKGWWAETAIERFGRILYCDFDIWVRKPIDDNLLRRLYERPAPRFLDIPGYKTPNKTVGCGCVYYSEDMDASRFLDLLYNKWKCDERAWTEALDMTREKLLESKMDMSPEIVDICWLLDHPEERESVYIVHGISSVDNGRRLLFQAGYSEDEIRFASTFTEEAIHRLGNIKRWFRK